MQVKFKHIIMKGHKHINFVTEMTQILETMLNSQPNLQWEDFWISGHQNKSSDMNKETILKHDEH